MGEKDRNDSIVEAACAPSIKLSSQPRMPNWKNTSSSPPNRGRLPQFQGGKKAVILDIDCSLAHPGGVAVSGFGMDWASPTASGSNARRCRSVHGTSPVTSLEIPKTDSAGLKRLARKAFALDLLAGKEGWLQFTTDFREPDEE